MTYEEKHVNFRKFYLSHTHNLVVLFAHVSHIIIVSIQKLSLNQNTQVPPVVDPDPHMAHHLRGA